MGHCSPNPTDQPGGASDHARGVVSALHRLEQQGLLLAEWRKTESGRDARFYKLTRAGRAQLEKELVQWERLSGAVGLVIRLAE